jgi:hypothetical protein
MSLPEIPLTADIVVSPGLGAATAGGAGASIGFAILFGSTAGAERSEPSGDRNPGRYQCNACAPIHHNSRMNDSATHGATVSA